MYVLFSGSEKGAFWKRGLLEKGAFGEGVFWKRGLFRKGSLENLEILEFPETPTPACGNQKDHFLEILENLKILYKL